MFPPAANSSRQTVPKPGMVERRKERGIHLTGRHTVRENKGGDTEPFLPKKGEGQARVCNTLPLGKKRLEGHRS